MPMAAMSNDWACVCPWQSEARNAMDARAFGRLMDGICDVEWHCIAGLGIGAQQIVCPVASQRVGLPKWAQPNRLAPIVINRIDIPEPGWRPMIWILGK